MEIDLAKELNALVGDKGRQTALDNALLWLDRAGVVQILRILGRVRDIQPDSSPNCIVASAMHAQKSAGYNGALDDLVYFRERYLKVAAAQDAVRPQFSALESLVQAGDITLEEAHAIRTGDYSKLKLSVDAAGGTAGTAARSPSGTAGPGSGGTPTAGKPKVK
jgi:hypothetical protein